MENMRRISVERWRRRIVGNEWKGRLREHEAYVQTGAVLTRKQIMEETGLSRATVTRHLSALRELGLIPES